LSGDRIDPFSIGGDGSIFVGGRGRLYIVK